MRETVHERAGCEEIERIKAYALGHARGAFHVQLAGHAGRNLPDKELRYLRTVIVTAAVYRSFGCELHLTVNPLP